MFPDAMPRRGINTENSFIRGSNLKGHKLPFWINVNLINTFKTQMNQGKQSFWVTISRREKDDAQRIISYMVYLIKVDMSFNQNTDIFVSVSAKLKCQILFQGISDATKIDIIQLNISFYNED